MGQRIYLALPPIVVRVQVEVVVRSVPGEDHGVCDLEVTAVSTDLIEDPCVVTGLLRNNEEAA